MTLVGHCQCLRCHRIATTEDMRAFGAQVKPAEMMPEVVHDYDVLRGR